MQYTLTLLTAVLIGLTLTNCGKSKYLYLDEVVFNKTISRKMNKAEVISKIGKPYDISELDTKDRKLEALIYQNFPQSSVSHDKKFSRRISIHFYEDRIVNVWFQY